MKFMTFGEIMLRLKSPGQECLFQSPMLEATFGGGEANVAVSLANYGRDVSYLTVLPDNAVAAACKGELRRFGVDTSRIVTGPGRVGIYSIMPEVFYDLEAPMMRCCAPDVPLPFSPVLEKLVVPNENMILDAVKKLL